MQRNGTKQGVLLLVPLMPLALPMLLQCHGIVSYQVYPSKGFDLIKESRIEIPEGCVGTEGRMRKETE